MIRGVSRWLESQRIDDIVLQFQLDGVMFLVCVWREGGQAGAKATMPCNMLSSSRFQGFSTTVSSRCQVVCWLLTLAATVGNHARHDYHAATAVRGIMVIEVTVLVWQLRYLVCRHFQCRGGAVYSMTVA
jgi:hypothetical protein